MERLNISDLKVIWYMAIHESTRWKRPIKTFWEDAVKSYLMLGIKQRNKVKRDLEINNHLISAKDLA